MNERYQMCSHLQKKPINAELMGEVTSNAFAVHIDSKEDLMR